MAAVTAKSHFSPGRIDRLARPMLSAELLTSPLPCQITDALARAELADPGHDTPDVALAYCVVAHSYRGQPRGRRAEARAPAALVRSAIRPLALVCRTIPRGAFQAITLQD